MLAQRRDRTRLVTLGHLIKQPQMVSDTATALTRLLIERLQQGRARNELAHEIGQHRIAAQFGACCTIAFGNVEMTCFGALRC